MASCDRKWTPYSSQGRLRPVSEHLLAEPVIVARMAQAALGEDHPIDWRAMAEDYNTRVRARNGFVLPSLQA